MSINESIGGGSIAGGSLDTRQHCLVHMYVQNIFTSAYRKYKVRNDSEGRVTAKEKERQEVLNELISVAEQTYNIE